MSSPYPDGTLIRKQDDTKVYVITNGKKRWIETGTVFSKLGYNWNCIVDEVASVVVDNIDTIEPLIDEDRIFQCGTSPSDTTPPSPNPMTWATQPYAASATSISMVATTATDSGSPPASYFFDFVSSPTGGAGGTDSSWQSSTSYPDTGLQANHRYGYRVKARDSASTPNETSYSLTVYKYTLANAPGAVAFSNVTQISIRANWTANGNRSGTQYYCENTTRGTNSGWTTNTYWNSSELTCETSYTFRVKARNGDGNATGWRNLGFQSTQTCPSDNPPETSITSGPSGTIDYNDVTFTYTGSDVVTPTASLMYSCWLEGYDSGWSSYTSSTSKTYNDLPNSFYTFKVRAKDQAGNVDPSPASRSFTVNALSASYLLWTR